MLMPQSKAYAAPAVTTYAIGDTGPAGGIIFYISGSTHYEASPVDLSNGVRWHNGSYLTTGATGTVWGTGKTNTDLIISVQGEGTYAASICKNYVLNGFNDWFLPSNQELMAMYFNLKNEGIGDFSNSRYWSSSEHSNLYAWAADFSLGGSATVFKNDSYAVRAVRSFVIGETFTVTFDKNGGDTDADPLTSSGIASGGYATLPTTEPTWAGHTFTGWNTLDNGSGTAFTASTPVTADITVYAQWTAITPTTYTLTVGSTAGGSVTVPGEGDFTYTEGTLVDLVAVADEGYQFIEWTDPAEILPDDLEEETTFTMPGQNVALTANFELIPLRYTLEMAIYPAGSGTATDDTNEGPYEAGAGVSISASAAPGYQFVNWTSSAGGTFEGVTNKETIFFTPAANTTVTANFELIPDIYTLTYDGNDNTGGTAPVDSTPYEAGDTVTVLGNTGSLAKTGYTFSGWNTQADGLGESYAPGATFDMPDNDITLYAKWTEVCDFKKDKLVDCGITGEGLSSASGLEKEFNPKSSANDKAGKKK